MPAAVLVAGLVAIALAFAAIAAALVVENLIVNPLKATQAAVSEVAVIGGVLAWLLGTLINALRYSVAGVQALVGPAQNQAADWWNYLVQQTVGSIFSWYFAQVVWLAAQEGWIAWLEQQVPALWTQVLSVLGPLLLKVQATANSTQAYVYGQLVPWVIGIKNDVDYLKALTGGILVPRVGAIGDDLARLHDWINQNLVTRGQLAQAEAATLARVTAIAVPIEAAIAEIENSPCMKACEPLGDLGNLIQALDDVGLMALMATLLEETINDPGAVQSVLRNDFVPLVRDAADMFGVHV